MLREGNELKSLFYLFALAVGVFVMYYSLLNGCLLCISSERSNGNTYELVVNVILWTAISLLLVQITRKLWNELKKN